jgi:hypothetical protein
VMPQSVICFNPRYSVISSKMTPTKKAKYLLDDLKSFSVMPTFHHKVFTIDYHEAIIHIWYENYSDRYEIFH